jgi:hypothetical protein
LTPLKVCFSFQTCAAMMQWVLKEGKTPASLEHIRQQEASYC